MKGKLKDFQQKEQDLGKIKSAASLKKRISTLQLRRVGLSRLLHKTQANLPWQEAHSVHKEKAYPSKINVTMYSRHESEKNLVFSLIKNHKTKNKDVAKDIAVIVNL